MPGAPRPVRVPARAPFLARRRLIAVATALPVAEYVLLQGFGLRSALPLAPQASAVAPFEVFHDLRFLMVFHAGWWTFAAELAALVALRAVLTPLFVVLAWPDDVPRPSFRRAVGNGVAYVALALVLLTPAAAILFTGAVIPLAWFFLAAFGVALLPLVLLHRVAYPVRWWRTLPSWRTVAWIALSGLVLTLAGLAVASSPAWVGVLPVAAAGVFNAFAWHGAVGAVAHAESDDAREPVVPLRHAGVAVAVAAVAVATAFGVAVWVGQDGVDPTDAGRSDRPVLVVLGFRSAIPPERIGEPILEGPFAERPFSYRGLGPDGLPLPYGPRATYQSLDVLVSMLDRQVTAFHEATGEPVTVVADSEGTLVAKLYLLSRPATPVEQLVMVSPIFRPARVYYPDSYAGGFGVGTRFALRREAQLVSVLVFPFGVDIPIVRSILRLGGVLRGGMTCALPGVRQLALLPLSSALAEPPPFDAAFPVVTVADVHGRITGAGELRDAAVTQVVRGAVPESGVWATAAAVIRGSAAAWQAPTLPVSLRAGWTDRAGCPGPAGRTSP